MGRAIIRNHCYHCDMDFYLPCIGGITLCSECEESGHTDDIGCAACEGRDVGKILAKVPLDNSEY